jgi:hypothetical protein
MAMNVKEDLVGKTITGVIATTSPGTGLAQIWMLQFADGSHVEFVSPAARKALQRAAMKPAKRAAGKRQGKPQRLLEDASMHFKRDCETGAQLSLNVA